MSISKQPLQLIVEKQRNHFWGRIEGHGFMPAGQGKTMQKLIQNIKDSIDDYINHEGEKDKFWSKIDLSKVQFEIHYDVQAFFEQFDELKINSIARNSGINESLMRQYATGRKHPSAEQAKKIDTAIHELVKKLESSYIYA